MMISLLLYIKFHNNFFNQRIEINLIILNLLK